MKTLSDLIDEGIHVRREAVRVIVTPACAARALELNTGNRYVRKANIEYLTKVIKAGEWQDEHSHGISFSDTGRLIDGQHRLMTIKQCGKSVIIRVDTGCKDDLQKHIDTGVVRAMCDRVQFSEDNDLNKKLTELVSTWIRVKTQTSRRLALSLVESCFLRWQNEATYLAQFYLDNRKKASCKGVMRATVNVAIMEAMRKDRSMAIRFLNSVMFTDGDCQPGRMLREWLLRNPGRGGFQHELIQYRMAWAALEAAMSNKDIKHLRPLSREMETIGYPLKEGE